MVRSGKMRVLGGRGLVLTATMTVVALMSAGCGSSKSNSSGSNGSSSSLGAADVATGSLLKVGYVTDGQNGSIDNLTEVPAAQAAVKYVNAHLGGVAGHVLSLDVCDSGGTPSGATDCVNQLITDKVPVVLLNVDGEAETTYGGLNKAGVPVMAYASVAQNELTGKLSYIVTNGLATTFAGPAGIAESVKAKRAAVFVTNVPAAAGPVQALDPIVYKNAGVPLDVVPIAPGTPDVTPEVQAQISKGVDFITIVGDVSTCSSVIKAERTLNFTGTTAVIAPCLAAGSSAGIPDGYRGVKLVTAATTDPTNADVKLYEAAMKVYAPGTAPFANGTTPGGWATVISFANAMKGLSGTPTSASIEAAFSSMSPQPIPFGDGNTFQCNGQQVAITPAICSTGALSATLNQAGNAVGAFTVINVASLLKL